VVTMSRSSSGSFESVPQATRERHSPNEISHRRATWTCPISGI
jgi:hypothetical protein